VSKDTYACTKSGADQGLDRARLGQGQIRKRVSICICVCKNYRNQAGIDESTRLNLGKNIRCRQAGYRALKKCQITQITPTVHALMKRALRALFRAQNHHI